MTNHDEHDPFWAVEEPEAPPCWLGIFIGILLGVALTVITYTLLTE